MSAAATMKGSSFGEAARGSRLEEWIWPCREPPPTEEARWVMGIATL
jgi:hypothetical protein